MTDLGERFRSLDRTSAPELWTDVESRPPRPLPPSAQGRRLIAAATAFVVAIGGFVVAVSAFRGEPPVARDSPASGTVENGLIAVAQGPDADIVLLDPATGASTALVERHQEGQTGGLQMAWSPDGSRLAFTDYRDNDAIGLFVLDLTSDEFIDVSSGLVNADQPAWSPDGTQIAFTGVDSETGYEIYVVGFEGTGLRRVTDEPDDGVSGAHMPVWSPDGTRIAFAVARYDGATETERSGIAIVDPETKDETIVSDTSEVDQSPSWSPDGTRIAFLRNVTGTAQVFVANADGTGERLILRDEVDHIVMSPPLWSPDSSHVLFGAHIGAWGIWLANADGSGARAIIEDAFAAGPVWAPDGSLIAFVGDDAGRPLPRVAIRLIRPDGSEDREIGSMANVSELAWQPVLAESPEPTASPSDIPPRTQTPLNARVSAIIQIGAFPGAVAVGGGAVWATVDNANGGPDDHLLLKIDFATNEIVETVPLSEAGDVAVGAGAVWVAASQDGTGVIVRIDPTSNDVVATIPVGSYLSSVAFGLGDLWVTRGTDRDPAADEVVRIEPATNQVIARIAVIGGEARDVVVGEGSVWVYGHSRRTGDSWEASSLWQIDPMTNEVVATVLDENGFLGAGSFLPDNVAIGAGWVWAADEHSNGVRIDPVTGQSTTFRMAEGGFAWPFAAYEGHVFFGLGTVRVLDIDTLEVVASIALESQVADAALDPATGTLWIANYEGSVTRVDLH